MGIHYTMFDVRNKELVQLQLLNKAYAKVLRRK